MNVRSCPVWIVLVLALAGLVPGCAEVADDEQVNAEVDGQESTLTPGNVDCAVQLDQTLLVPGDRVALTAELTPERGGYYEVRVIVTRPDGSRSEVARWDYDYLRPGVRTRLSTQWVLDSAARAGIYGVSLTVTPLQGTAQYKHNLGTYRVTQVSAPPPPPGPMPGAGRGVSVSGRNLIDASGRVFVPRGPELVTAQVSQVAEIDAIAATGANSLRMLLTLDTANQMTPQGFDQLIGRAVGHKMIVWISLFTWDNSRNREIAPALGGGNLQKMSDYLVVWQRQWLKDLVNKYNGWVVVDAMQEFKSSITPPEDPRAVREWVNAAKEHLRFFRQQGFTQPLEIMTSFEGRDLAAIVNNADEILGAETRVLNNTKQTLFGWQAYWGTDFYRYWQGGLLIGKPMTATEAVQQFVATRSYPIMVGLDSIDIPGNEAWDVIMPACAARSVGWLWWEWNELKSMSHGVTVRTASTGFAGAVRVVQ